MSRVKRTCSVLSLRGIDDKKCGISPVLGALEGGAPERYAVLHHPTKLSQHSGMDGLADAINATKVYYSPTWHNVQQKSWTLGQMLRVWGNRWYGSEWNALVPFIDEMRICRRIRGAKPKVVHFLWAEFARPRSVVPYHRKNACLVGTFHASARKQPTVIRSNKVFEVFDAITLMSRSQQAFFVARGVPEDRIHVILHGVDVDFFVPGPHKRGENGQPLKGLLVGKTERDHEFMAELLRRIPQDLLDFSIGTAPEHLELYYRDIAHINRLPWLDDEGLRAQYQHADLLLMPLHDCAANNAVLEAMACGTPIMANRVGGISEYVPPQAGILTDGKNIDEWIETLKSLIHQRERLQGMGRAARKRAEELAWDKIAYQFELLYRSLCDRKF